jgi:hypothetical protein
MFFTTHTELASFTIQMLVLKTLEASREHGMPCYGTKEGVWQEMGINRREFVAGAAWLALAMRA